MVAGGQQVHTQGLQLHHGGPGGGGVQQAGDGVVGFNVHKVGRGSLELDISVASSTAPLCLLHQVQREDVYHLAHHES